MPPRRAHKKSRNGCDPCKKRHIKCDEGGPPCWNCVSRRVECRKSSTGVFRHWDVEHASLNEDNTSKIETVSHEPDSAIDIRHTEFNRFRELELMHHWCTKTCHSFSRELSAIFNGRVVELALQHHYLMESILALTSLHIATTKISTESDSYVHDALNYQDSAVPAFRDALKTVTASNCDALFAYSIILMACTAVSPFVSEQSDGVSASETLLLLIPFVKGIHVVIDIGRQWLQNGPFRDIIIVHPETELLNMDDSILPIQHLKKVQEIINFDKNSQLIYDRVISLLGNSFSKERNMAIPWLILAGDDFLERLKNNELLAQVIYMYWGVLLDRLDDIWWAKCLGQRLVEELSSTLTGKGKESDEAVEWARQEVALQNCR